MPSHELRTPLAPLMTGLALFKRGPLDAGKDAKTREIIERQARSITRLVDDLLDISRIGHGRMQLARDRVDIADVLGRRGRGLRARYRVGIAPEMLPQIFEAFVQQPDAIGRSRGGMGLGLAIVKGLVELHGGRVSAHSAGADQGTDMVVRLPADRRP